MRKRPAFFAPAKTVMIFVLGAKNAGSFRTYGTISSNLYRVSVYKSIVKTPTLPQLNLTYPRFGFYMENDFTQPPTPTTTLNSTSAISQLLLTRF